MHETWVQSLDQEDLLEEEWQPTPVFLPGKSRGWRSLVGYSPWGRKESDTTSLSLSLKWSYRVFFIFYYGVLMCSVFQVYPTLCSPMDCNPPGSSAHGLFQARILEQDAISFLYLLHWQVDSLPLLPPGKPSTTVNYFKC